MDAASPAPLVGRAVERAAIASALKSLRTRPGGIVSIEGEPGIGKSRLLGDLVLSASGCTVLDARASEFERDLPYALFTEALDGHVSALDDRARARLGVADPGALSGVLPALAHAGDRLSDRHRTHRALRDLLERLAATRPLLLCLDDVHWADPASLDALAALGRRPPAAPVLMAVTAREGQLPPTLATALGAAAREERLTRLSLGPLAEAEAAELVGGAVAAVYRQAGGNPFYLEQLARAGGAAPGEVGIATDDSVPPAVAAAIGAELAALTREARVMLDAAAVTGDPFDPDLAAAVAELPEAEALRALDELLACALVRPAGAPRQFAFRHPVVRHAVYVAAAGGWRLGAHARAADALERHGVGPVRRAHHVEHAARPGDADAIDLLSAAASELQSPAPATAARFHAAALRLLPDRAEQRERRARMQVLLADAQAAAGDARSARETLVAALRTAPAEQRLPLTVALANQEWWLGGHEQARRRLHVALGDLPAEPSPDRIRLRLALALTALSACDLRDAQNHASDARDDARAIGDPVFEVAALAGGSLAGVLDAGGPEAVERLAESSVALERLTEEQLATRLPAFWMHGRARRALGRFDAALADLERGAVLAADTGRERVSLMLALESVPVLIELGRLAEASTAAEEGIELARLAATPRMLLWAHSAQASARLAAGDVGTALQHAVEAAGIDEQADIHAAGQPGWCHGAALVAAGDARRGLAALLQGLGGVELTGVLPVDRPAAAADLADAQLASGDAAAAEEALARGEAAAGTAWARALIGVARSAVMFVRGQPQQAVVAAAAAHEAAAGAPLTRARARLAEGRALAAQGQRTAAVEALREAERALDGFGALRLRDQAVRELRQLGHRVVRPAREAAGGPLTVREREVAALIAAGRTNREIAEQLVLSTRTIEAHLRNIYGKLGVRSRVDLAREVERGEI